MYSTAPLLRLFYYLMSVIFSCLRQRLMLTCAPVLHPQVIHVTGRIRCRPALVPGSTRSVRRPMGLVALAHTLPPSTLNEVRMESHMFVFRVNMDLQVIYCENRYATSQSNEIHIYGAHLFIQTIARILLLFNLAFSFFPKLVYFVAIDCVKQ